MPEQDYPAIAEEILKMAEADQTMRDAGDGEVEKADIAYLADRVQTKERGSQVYSTQFRKLQDGTYEPWPIEDREHVDDRRAALGLEPFAEYQARMRQKNERMDAKRGEA